MAEQVKIELVVVDKTSAALNKTRAGIVNVNNSLVRMGTLAQAAALGVAAIGASRIARGIVNVGRQVENLETRFKFLFGSAEEGARAFETLTEFAGTVPFTLEEIAAASGNLAVVSKDAEQLGKNLQLTANVAAISGLDFRTAGEQIQRALSGGISAADLLRERGIKALLGFKDGVKVTTAETQEAFDRVFGPDGEFGQAALALTTTFDGLQSMVQDKFFNIQRIISDSGPFDTLKAAVSLLDKALGKNFDNIKEKAQEFGQAIVNQSKVIIIGAAGILDSLEPVFNFVADSFNNIMAATAGLPPAIKTLGVVGFLMLGLTGKAIVLTIGAVFNEVIEMIALMGDAYGAMISGTANILDKLGFDKQAQEYRDLASQVAQDTDKLRKKFDHQSKTTKTAAGSLEDYKKILINNPEILGKNQKAAIEYIMALEAEEKALAATNKKLEEKQKQLKAVRDAQGAATNFLMDYKNALGDTFNEAAKAFDPVKEAVDITIDGFKTLKQGVGDAFADAILGAKTLSEALGNLANQVLRQLISGIIQLGLELFVFRYLRDYLKDILNLQAQLNSQLRTEIGLRAVLSFFTGGFGGFFADGGSVKGGQPIVVGEEGPELFVPPSNGTIVPNDQMGGMGGAGAVNVNFNIQAVDAAGVDELLVNRRNTIVGIINQAMNMRGKQGVTT